MNNIAFKGILLTLNIYASNHTHAKTCYLSNQVSFILVSYETFVLICLSARASPLSMSYFLVSKNARIGIGRVGLFERHRTCKRV